MKKILLIIIVIILCGCSAKVNLNIDKDGVIDNALVTQLKSDSYFIDGDFDRYANNLVDLYSNQLTSNDYSYKTNVQDDKFMVDLNKQKKVTICDYFNRKKDYIGTFFSDLTCIEDNDSYKINGKVSYFNCDESCMEPPEISDIQLNITSKLNIIDENASEKEGNTYTWNFSEGSNNTFSLTLQKSKKDIIRNKIDSITSNKKVIVLSILGAIGILALVVLILMNKYKKNKIDY